MPADRLRLALRGRRAAVHIEERTHLRQQFRVMSELVRYHQTGTASGWIELDGERTRSTPRRWVSTRDHSWGVRYDVGVPPADVEPRRASRPVSAS